MKASRSVALALAACLSASSAMAGLSAPVPRGSSASAPVGVWLIMACAGSIIFVAFLASRQQNRELSGREATTCGIAYWLNPQGR